MSRKIMNLFYVLKVNISTINSKNNHLKLSFDEAKQKGMIITLGDNQLLKFIRQIRNIEYSKDYVRDLYRQRDIIKNSPRSKENSEEIVNIQKKINELLFIPDLVSVKADTSKKDYKDICKNGFKITSTINGKVYEYTYKRLCAGAGQLRRNTALFACTEILDSLEQIMMCGLTKKKIGKINLAKFSAYFSLYTSSSNQVKRPNICVVKDFEYTLKSQKVSWIYDIENNEYDIEDRIIDIEQNAFDGSGMILPEMAERWATDLNIDYVPSSFIVRAPYIKGLVSVFDFRKFAKEVAHKNTITDYWGKEYDINDIDVILTTSQFKMYKYYSSFDEYMFYIYKYNHIFSVTRMNKRRDNTLTPLNYQYIQSNNFTKESIKSLADYSVEWVKKIMTCDKMYAMLFLIGKYENDDSVAFVEDNTDSYIPKVLMYNSNILNDSYIRQKIIRMLEKKVRQLKIGKLFVEGSYDFCIPDLYAMAEHAFGMEVHGLLKEKQGWCKRWVDKGSPKVSVMRSPLVAPSENHLLDIYNDDKTQEWFQHIKSGMVFNIWDTSMIRMSDADYDGDLCLSTDNIYVLEAVDDTLPPITYEKKKASVQTISANNFANMDVKSFNSKIGFITNLASNFIAMRTNYSKDSEEYKILSKRIDLLRRYQGSAIDSTKGEIFTPPPRNWSRKQRYLDVTDDMSENQKLEIKEANKKIAFENRITGDKKPYFFGYIYPKYMDEYKRHIKNYRTMCDLMYDMKLNDLLYKKDKTPEEESFARKYNYHLPLLTNNCIMNTLTKYVESIEFDNKWRYEPKEKFDYHDLLSRDCDLSDKELYQQVRNTISEFCKKYSNFISQRKELEKMYEYDFGDDDSKTFASELGMLINDYETKLFSLCNNGHILADYVIDVYYRYFTNKQKLLLWNEIGEFILENVKAKSKRVEFPVMDEEGIEYLGNKYSLKVIEYNGNI